MRPYRHFGTPFLRPAGGPFAPPATSPLLSLALSDGEAAVHWCQRHKLLSDRKMYPKCGTDMRLVKRKGANSEDMGWQKGMRCPAYGDVFLRAATTYLTNPLHDLPLVHKGSCR